MADEPRPNRPASGAYGEKADLERLKKSLPSSGQEPPRGSPAERSSATGGPPLPSPGGPTGRPPRPVAPEGVPPALLYPTERPDERLGQGPVLQPPSFAEQAIAQSVNAAQRRLVILDMLATSPTVSAETREWAQEMLTLILEVTE